MLSRRGSRWAGTGISNGRLRLASIPASSRNFSLNASSRTTSRLTRPSIAPKQTHSVQIRSLSLFGWGSSAKTPVTDGSVLPAASDAQNIDIGPSSLNNVRTIRASHETSDAPDPSLTPDSNDGIAKPVLDQLTETITSPADSDKFEHLLQDGTPIAATSEYIGYLRETCGLDFGWGPSSAMQFLFEHIHISGGLSWTASIIVLSTVLRLSMVPAMVAAQKESQKMKDIAPYVNPLRAKYQSLIAEGNRVKAMEVGTEMRALNKAANIKYSRMLVPLLIQIPFQFGAFRMLRASADLPIPAYVNQSWLWNADLSLSDPYYITPALSAGLIYLQFSLSQKQQTMSANSPVTPNMMKVVGKVIPAASFLFMFWQPGAVQLYFLTSSALAIGTTWALRQTAIRGMVNLPPLAPVGAPAAAAAATALAIGGTAATAPASKEILKGGLRSRPKGLTEPVVEAVAEPEPDRSIIDKGVDHIKSFMKKPGSSIGAAATATEKKMDKKAQDVQKERARKYEQDHKRKLRLAREERNKEVRDGQA